MTGNKIHKKLKEKIGNSSVIGVVEFDLPAARGRKARRVTQEIRAEKILFQAPFRLGNKLSNVSINVVLAREINAPQDVEPIEWLLLTSLPIETTEQALKVISWYVCRWQIEIFFRILKSGCEVEELQLQTIERLKPCLGLYMIVAWRILHMTMLGRSCPDMPCSTLFDEEEWHAAYIVVYRRAVPLEPPDLNTMICCGLIKVDTSVERPK